MKNSCIKVQCPAKINLTLKVLDKREDGFHNIESIMQTIDLFDYLTITLTGALHTEIILKGNSPDIPYDETNLVYKAAKLFLDECNLSGYKIDVYIEKNIPVCAGLAGGSTDAAGMIYGLNKLFEDCLSENELHKLCAKLGSDLNVCLKGGCLLAKGRGEIIEPQEFKSFKVNLVKPLSLGISAKEAYMKFSNKREKNISTELRKNFANDLEWAVIEDYPQLQSIKNIYPSSVMTGSGSAYYSLKEEFEPSDGYWVKNGLKSINKGVSLIEKYRIQ